MNRKFAQRLTELGNRKYKYPSHDFYISKFVLLRYAETICMICMRSWRARPLYPTLLPPSSTLSFAASAHPLIYASAKYMHYLNLRSIFFIVHF